MSVGAGESSLTLLIHVSESIFREFASVLGQGKQVWLLLHVLVSIFGDFAWALGRGKQVWLFFFTSHCLCLDILRECLGNGSKLDYSSSRLSVYIWRFYVSVGVGEGRLTIFLYVLVSIFGDFTSVLGHVKQVWLYFFTSRCLYLEILCQWWGRGSKLDYSSSCLSVYI